jgi:hypothetical protein
MPPRLAQPTLARMERWAALEEAVLDFLFRFQLMLNENCLV